MGQKERNRKGHFDDKAAKRAIDIITKALQEQLTSIEKEIKERMDKDKERQT
jgi:cytidylate kinase